MSDTANEKKGTKFDFDKIKAILDKMDNRIKDLSNDVKNKYIPETETKVKDNLLISLLVAFGAGLLSGLTIMLFGLICGKRK